MEQRFSMQIHTLSFLNPSCLPTAHLCADADLGLRLQIYGEMRLGRDHPTATGSQLSFVYETKV